MAACLLLAAAVWLVSIKPRDKIGLIVCAAYLSIVPLITGIANGYGLRDVMRDYLPFAYVVLMSVTAVTAGRPASEQGVKLILMTLFVVGGISAVHALDIAVREFGSLHDFNLTRAAIFAGGEPEGVAKPINLEQLQIMYGKAIDPAILFTAIYLLGSAISDIYRKIAKPGIFVMKIVIGLLCAYSFVVMGIRLYLILLAAALMAVAMMEGRKYAIDRRMAVSVLASGVAIVYLLFWDQLILMATKFASIGSNGRIAEWEGVIRYLSGSAVRTIVGDGWGATWNNPILGSEVRFTHSFLSFLLLKTGVLGLAAVAYLAIRGARALATNWAGYDMHRQLLVMAGSFAVLSVLIHTTYKSLSTGIIFVMLVLVYQSSVRATGTASQR